MKTVGTNRLTYPVIRNIAGLPLRAYRVKPVRNAFPWIAGPWSLFRPDLQERSVRMHTFRDWKLQTVDLHHFFNSVSLEHHPWFATFESYLPRYLRVEGTAPIVQRAVAAMAGKWCCQIFAMSESARRLQEAWLRRFAHPAECEAVLQKLSILHPSQAIVNEPRAFRPEVPPLRLAFVGNAFSVKGGCEVAIVCDRLLDEGIPLRLDVVSNFETSINPYLPDFRERFMQLRAKHPDAIFLHQNLPHDSVLDLFRRSHVALLPSYAETYGYVILEAQSTGCPVITTNIRAMPEINNDQVGWIIEVPKDAYGVARFPDQRAIEHYSGLLQEQLYSLIKQIVHNPETISVKGVKAQERIREAHSPVAVARVLESHYDAALERPDTTDSDPT